MSAIVKIKDVKCIQHTPSAALMVKSDKTQTWVPQSVIHDDSEVWKRDTEGTLIVHSWFKPQLRWRSADGNA